jgi:hypothetical protein
MPRENPVSRERAVDRQCEWDLSVFSVEVRGLPNQPDVGSVCGEYVVFEVLAGKSFTYPAQKFFLLETAGGWPSLDAG